MTGVIQGSLKNFAMEYGEPASFVLDLESVPKRGVAQSISTDAIQSISILGTGAGSALNRGITQLFREYPYSKIGLRCVLKNDQFSVNGTIHEGGKEYLVRRGLFRGVDVVNQNPDNVISFRDMEERLKRISRSAETGPSGIKEKADVNRLVSEENRDRTALYTEIIKANNIDMGTLPEVQRIFANSWRGKSASGWWIQQDNGQWAKK